MQRFGIFSAAHTDLRLSWEFVSLKSLAVSLLFGLLPVLLVFGDIPFAWTPRGALWCSHQWNDSSLVSWSEGAFLGFFFRNHQIYSEGIHFMYSHPNRSNLGDHTRYRLVLVDGIQIAEEGEQIWHGFYGLAWIVLFSPFSVLQNSRWKGLCTSPANMVQMWTVKMLEVKAPMDIAVPRCCNH